MAGSTGTRVEAEQFARTVLVLETSSQQFENIADHYVKTSNPMNAFFKGTCDSSLYKRIKDREIVAWTDPAGRYRFPAWQFGVDGLRPGVVECLKLLQTNDHWAVMKFFLTSSEMADDVAPLELLRNHRVDEAKAIASAVGFRT